MRISRDTVDEMNSFFMDNLDDVTELINFSRRRLGDVFDEDVAEVSSEIVMEQFNSVVENEDLALNLSALIKIGVHLEIRNDYAGFIVDELIGRQIASVIAGDQPHGTLAEATFHYIDIHTDEVLSGDESAGEDDVLAGLAAGLQTRIPGWSWEEKDF